jgi:predicted ester cyclase
MPDANTQAAEAIFEEAWNREDKAILEGLVVPEVVLHNLPAGLPSGLEGYGEYINMYRNAFPDFYIEVVETEVKAADTVVVYFTFHGTHEGELMGIEPTGIALTVDGDSTLRFVDERVVEVWDEFDPVRQLTASLPPEQTVTETQVQAAASAGSGLSKVHYFVGQSLVDIDTSLPAYTPVASYPLPAGKYMVTAGLEIHGTTERDENQALHPPTAMCRLTGPGGDRDQGTFTLDGRDVWVITDVTLRGAFVLDAPGTITLECTRTRPGGGVQARGRTLIAVEVDDIAFDFTPRPQPAGGTA